MKHVFPAVRAWALAQSVFLSLVLVVTYCFPGCVAPRPAARVTWEPVHVGLPGTVWVATIDGHDYLLIARGNRAGVVHSEACRHSSHR